MKAKGELPWRHWFDSHEYVHYGKSMREYFKPLEHARTFLY